MDELTHSGIYFFDPNLNTVKRHATGTNGPTREVEVNITTAMHLMNVRRGMLALVQSNPLATESAIAAWQDALAVYFAHWEE